MLRGLQNICRIGVSALRAGGSTACALTCRAHRTKPVPRVIRTGSRWRCC